RVCPFQEIISWVLLLLMRIYLGVYLGHMRIYQRSPSGGRRSPAAATAVAKTAQRSPSQGHAHSSTRRCLAGSHMCGQVATATTYPNPYGINDSRLRPRRDILSFSHCELTPLGGCARVDLV